MVTMKYTLGLDYTLTDNNLHIEDSYKIGKRAMGVILTHIKNTAETPSKVWNRSMFSLRMEWAVHNFLYSIGYKRERTADVDLDYPNKIEWLYCILGCLVWIFVK